MADDPTSASIAGTSYRVNPALASRVNQLIADAPPELQSALKHGISSGYRTFQQQTQLYLNHLNGGGLAAPPGHSWHERLGGMAVDWNNVTTPAWQYLKQHAKDYGLVFPFGASDPYHMQLASLPTSPSGGGVSQSTTVSSSPPISSGIAATAKYLSLPSSAGTYTPGPIITSPYIPPQIKPAVPAPLHLHSSYHLPSNLLSNTLLGRIL